MSLWHSPHFSESMKKFDGMIPPTLVFADEGKNGDCGPPPSPAIVTGGFIGLTIRCVAGGYIFMYWCAASGNTSAKTAATCSATPNVRGAPHERINWNPYGSSAATPISAAIIWVRSTH